MADGQQQFELAGPDRQEAERLYRRRKREVANGTYVKKAKRQSPKRFQVSRRPRPRCARRFAAEFIEGRRNRHPPVRTVHEDEARLKHHVLPRWGDRSLETLDDDDVRELLAAIRAAPSFSTG